jgi:hypothetical protein
LVACGGVAPVDVEEAPEDVPEPEPDPELPEPDELDPDPEPLLEVVPSVPPPVEEGETLAVAFAARAL